MPVSMVVRLRWGVYQAASARPSQPEWPPAPSRLVCALVATARGDAEWAAVRWLAEAGHPLIWACEQVNPIARAGYVVTNSIVARPKHQVHPGRIAQPKQRVGVGVDVDSFAFTWPDADADAWTVGLLRQVAWRVPYLGRSDSPAEITVVDGEPEQHASWTCWEPAALSEPETVAVSSPYPGYVQALEQAYVNGRRSWEVNRLTAYRKRADRGDAAEVVDSPYPAGNVFVFGLESGRVPYRGEVWMKLTDMLRRAVIERVADPVPAQVCGHGADGQLHAAYLALPDVGGEYSDGHLLGVAVGLPATLPESDTMAALRGLVGLKTLTVGGQHIALEYDSLRRKPWGLAVERWTGGQGGARRWVTATPLSLDDKHLRSKSIGWAEARLAAGLVRAGYPEPCDVVLSRSPLLSGVAYRPMWTAPGRDGRPIMHAMITFPCPVRGLLVAGATRYLGGGLCCPVPSEGGTR